MKLKRPPNETVELFREFMNEHDHNPSKQDIIQFVSVSSDALENASSLVKTIASLSKLEELAEETVFRFG